MFITASKGQTAKQILHSDTSVAKIQYLEARVAEHID